MNVIEQARNAYAPNQTAIRTDRSVEAQLISRITARLRRTQSQKPADFPALIAAVYENRRMWTTMAADVADKGNGLPAPLRAQIFYLAEFTEHHSKRIIRREADVAPLIEINTAIMRGLNGQGPS